MIVTVGRNYTMSEMADKGWDDAAEEEYNTPNQFDTEREDYWVADLKEPYSKGNSNEYHVRVSKNNEMNCGYAYIAWEKDCTKDGKRSRISCCAILDPENCALI